VNSAIIIASVLGALALGGLAGFRLGKSCGTSRRAYWSMNGAAVICCAALNFAGIIWGMGWLAYGALGLMGGLITGMKYGYFDAANVWRSPPAREGTESADIADQADDLESAHQQPLSD
jgi:hypothetical protein